MLEQARFSLARAGVMVGLCGLVVLGAGWVMNSSSDSLVILLVLTIFKKI